MRRALVVAVSVLAFGGASAAGAQASTWTVAKLPAAVEAAFYGVSCPSTSLCVAVGGDSTVAASTNPSAGASAWNIGHPGGSVDLPVFARPSYGGGQIRGVSCPTTQLCVAVSLEGRLYTSTDPAGGAAAWKVVEQAESGPNIHMYGVSCPSPSLCVVAGYGGKILFSTNPTGDAAAWTVTTLPQPFDLRGISCPSVSLCVAVGNEGVLLASTDPTGGPEAWKVLGVPAGPGYLNAVSCPAPSLCVTANAGQILTSTNPAGGASSWSVVPAGTGLPVTGISCPTTLACAAFDNNADAIVSTAPTAGTAAWSFENVVPYDSPHDGDETGDGRNGTFGISCPTTSLCAAVGQGFRILTTTDPFAQEPKRPIRRSKRPHVVITAHPAKRVDGRKGGRRVAFRFRAIGSAAGFRCKLDRRRFRPCKAPKRYRVGGGKHRFKVRAVALGGTKGPPATFHFRVGPLTERGPVGTCKPSQESSLGKPCVETG